MTTPLLIVYHDVWNILYKRYSCVIHKTWFPTLFDDQQTDRFKQTNKLTNDYKSLKLVGRFKKK